MEDDKKLVVNIMAGNETILCGGIYPPETRLTPTGKISRAKTRVYTQRYRKDWEQMPDFKGWLNPVHDQPTRAYCTYCKKNLHAHRLSLLKHTCTMKHQRAALMHQNEMKTAIEKVSDIGGSFEDVDSEMGRKEMDREYEESEEFEYVVETLDMEEDELNDTENKTQNVDSTEEYYEESNINTSIEEDHEISNKKVKIERADENCHDALAQAMVHVHGEYLDGTDEQVNIQMEMVVGDDEVTQETENEVSLNSIEDEADESQNNEDLKRSISGDKTSAEGDSSELGSESESSPVHRLENISSSFKSLKEAFNSSKLVSSDFGTPVSIPAGQIKTIRLDSGKTVTLRAGTQYILSNLKDNQLPSLLLAKKKKESQSDIKSALLSSNSAPQKKHYLAVASTSKQTNQGLTKVADKKPCISTHVLDMTKGLPIGGLQVSLYKLMDGKWTFLNESYTKPNGRCHDLVDNSRFRVTVGRYKIHFDVDKYFTLRCIETIYPFIEIVFDVKNPTGNYHIPVLLSPFGYTTYRGSER